MCALRLRWCRPVVLVLFVLLLMVVFVEARDEVVYPISRGDPEDFMPVFSPSHDEPAPLPTHPPIDEIAPMPMPTEETGCSNPEGPRTVIAYNAETGESREYRSVRSSGQPGGMSEPGYQGIGDVVPEPLLQRGFGTMVAAGSLDSFPRSPNVKLVMRYGTDYYVCSGSMNDAGVVLTAAHCVYNRGYGAWADEIWVYPAWDGVGNCPPGIDEAMENFGWARGTSYIAGSDYINDGNHDRDCGCISLSDRSVGMLTGWYGWTWGYDCSWAQGHTYYNFSYPSENCPTPGLHTGRTMYSWHGTIDSCPNNQLQINTGNQCLTAGWGGMSGSAAYWIDVGDYRRAHAVASTSDRSTWSRYCKLWEQFTVDMETLKNETRGGTFDLEALMFRSSGTTTVEAGGSLPNCNVRICNATNADPGSATYTLRVYLSTNNNISAGDTLLATWNYGVDFAAMQCGNFNVPGPSISSNTPGGTYWVGVVLDSSTDTNYSNNDADTWDAEEITVTCSPVSAPSWVDASDGTYQQYVYVDWPSVSGATEYRVYRNDSPLSWTTDTYYHDTLGAPGSVYYYKVQARKACGVGSESSFSPSNTGLRRLTFPTGVSATDGAYEDRVGVTWNGVYGAGGYRLYRSETLGGAKTALSSWITSTSYDDTTTDPFTTYYYWVQAATDTLGNYPSDYSSSNTGYRDPSSPAAFRVDDKGNTFADGSFYGSSFQSGSADVAEWVSVSEPVEPGDVLELDPDNPGQYRKSQTACSSLVAGVVSTDPGFILGSSSPTLDFGHWTLDSALLALIGIVPVKVTNEGGAIQPGDLLVSSSTPGYAMRWDPGDGSSCGLIGKALEPLEEDNGIILVLLTAH